MNEQTVDRHDISHSFDHLNRRIREGFQHIVQHFGFFVARNTSLRLAQQLTRLVEGTGDSELR